MRIRMYMLAAFGLTALAGACAAVQEDIKKKRAYEKHLNSALPHQVDTQRKQQRAKFGDCSSEDLANFNCE